uniref:Glucagon-like peptide 1 receptor n=1 Tax=Phallusia mammillata TaxID=59560 RepID=A0A6F9DEE9_9ASCI|nr:glucagon-like peptide 1 receptor [Phallusia mammillata]
MKAVVDFASIEGTKALNERMGKLAKDRYSSVGRGDGPKRKPVDIRTGGTRTSYLERKRFTTGKLFRVAVLVVIMMQLPQATPKDIQEMMCHYLDYKRDCLQKLNETAALLPANETWCRGDFDGYVCWNHARPGLSYENCPEFIPWKNETLKSFRMCQPNGSWFSHVVDGELITWQHVANCNPLSQQTPIGEESSEVQQVQTLVRVLTIVYTTGYAISLVCLTVALFLLAFFKKLHCTRNYIHINLMISFILRYIAVLVKDKVLDEHYDIESRLSGGSMEFYCDDYGGISGLMVGCRLSIIMMHYAIIVNYFWLLAEGVYLQMLLVFAMADNKYFPMFMAFGWGAPWIPVGLWTALRLSLSNQGCWELNESLPVWWALQAPVIVSIGINFLIFINIIRIIVSKLRANNMPRNDYKYRLARSTLALIPLLGIHYIVFLFVVGDGLNVSSPAMHVKIAFEMTFTSLQGMLIAVLYCFLNGEVQGEVTKLWRNWRWRKGLPAATSRKSSTYHSNGGTQMTSMNGHCDGHSTNHTDHLLVPADSLASRRGTDDSSIRNSLIESGEPLMGNGFGREESV